MGKKGDADPGCDSIAVKGFFRLQVVNQDGSIDGDTGWVKNMITQAGFQEYLAYALSGYSGSRQVKNVSLGTGGAPASNATSLSGEIHTGTGRVAVATSAMSFPASSQVQYRATFASSVYSTQASTRAISNIGLFGGTESTQPLFAGKDYTSQSWNQANQDVNITYQLNFQTTT